MVRTTKSSVAVGGAFAHFSVGVVASQVTILRSVLTYLSGLRSFKLAIRALLIKSLLQRLLRVAVRLHRLNG